MNRLVPFAALLLLAGCADSEPPDPTPADDDGTYNMIDPVTAEVTQDTAPAIGEWTRTMQEEQSALAFGPTGAEPLFSIRCDEGEGILVNRHGLVDAGTAGMMVLILGTDRRELAVNPVQAPLPMLRAALPASDPLLTALRDHQGQLELVVGDGPPLVLPGSPMIGEFIQACASGDISPDAAADDGDGANMANAAAPAEDRP